MDESASKEFLSIASSLGWKSRKSVGREDYEEHWDYELFGNSKKLLVDLKSLKRINSSDEVASDKLILVELQAVRNTSCTERPGWLYGKADYICFEISEGFVFVKREKLKQYVEKTINLSIAPIKSNQNKKVHTIYYRWDRIKNESRCDKFVYLDKQEILKLQTAIWRKGNALSGQI